ncbi:hypothetical protein [Emticicia soli]|uniref:Uncharacterized protein n=1 Tax=Emticicia soli TaxID=2027878 RepID=A0ABW5J2Y9_9BACT
MKSLLSTIASILLIFNGLSAIYGGWHLITSPDGSSLQMPLIILDKSPFTDYYIPGIILFVANGIASLAVFVAILVKPRKLAWLISVQGAILTGWILIQVIMIQAVSPLHFIYGAVGVALIVVGRQITQSSRV